MGGVESNNEFQPDISGTINANGGTVDIKGPNSGTMGIQFSGTWVGTLVFEASQDGTTYTGLMGLQIPSMVLAANFTANGLNVVNSNAYKNLRVRATAWTSGTVTVTASGSDAVSLAFARALLFGATGNQITSTTISGKECLDVNANVSQGQLVPTITNKFRIRLSTSTISLPNTGVFTTIYSRSGTGLFFGFQADFASANINVRLTLDSAIFTVKIADIKTMQFNDTSAGRVQLGGFLTTIGNTLDFSSKFAIPYTTSVLIEAAVTDATAHNNNYYIVFQTEDT